MPSDGYVDIDTKTPSGARGYDYILGGTDNYAIDRLMVDQVEAMLPGTKAATRNNRRFLERAVRYLATDCGIRQFIDNGSGLPTQQNVHHIAQGVAPDSRVVYVDNDPVVIRHQKVAALAENANTAFILADARDVDAIVNHADTRRLIDFGQPAALLYLAFLHFIPDQDDPYGMVRRLMDRLVPGSYLIISHATADEDAVRQAVTGFIGENSKGNFGRVRTREEVAQFFEGLEVVEPGLVKITDWRPDGRDEEESPRFFGFGGIARKPAANIS
jgi:hypothetical protein